MLLLTEIADGTDELAHAVVLGHGPADGGIGYVDAVVLCQRPEDMVFALEDIEIKAVLIPLHGDLHVLEEEFFLALPHRLEQLHVLDAAVHHGAAVRRDDAVGKVEASLDGALEQGAAVFAQEARQIVCGDIDRAGPGRAQPRGKAARQVQERLRRVLAGVGDADPALLLRLPDQLVMRFQQEFFKIVQVLQIFQGVSHSSPDADASHSYQGCYYYNIPRGICTPFHKKN